MNKIHFGGYEPQNIDYRPQADGMAEVWLYRNIHEEFDADENSDWVAEGVFFKTALSKEEVEAQFSSYFKVEEPQATVEDLVEAIDILTDIVLGEE